MHRIQIDFFQHFKNNNLFLLFFVSLAFAAHLHSSWGCSSQNTVRRVYYSAALKHIAAMPTNSSSFYCVTSFSCGLLLLLAFQRQKEICSCSYGMDKFCLIFEAVAVESEPVVAAGASGLFCHTVRVPKA